MTTEEFVEAVNAIGNKDEIDAKVAPTDCVLLSKMSKLVKEKEKEHGNSRTSFQHY